MIIILRSLDEGPHVWDMPIRELPIYLKYQTEV
jgi:hypothetical protein